MKHEHTRGSGGMLPRENLKFRSSKTARNAPKTRILLIPSLSIGIPHILVAQIVLHAVHAAKISSARTRSRGVLPYSADWPLS